MISKYNFKPVKKRNQDLKRYLKFLSICKNPTTTSQVIRSAPEKVIKVICNAALNAQQGEISLTPSQKKQFSKHRNLFSSLISKSIPIVKKRKILSQKGGAAVLPILLSAILSALPLLFKR